MKSKLFLTGILIFLLVFGMFFLTCDNGGNGNSGGTLVLTYKGNANNKTYVLRIIDNQSFNFEVGDTNYEFGYYDNTCHGTVSKNGNTWIVTPDQGLTFTVTVSTSGITAITGTITYAGGRIEAAPVAIVPSGYSSEIWKETTQTGRLNDNRIFGKWEVEKFLVSTSLAMENAIV